MGVAVSQYYAYVADYNSGLRIIDITNPYSLFEVGHCNLPLEAMGVTICGNYAYVANKTFGLGVINITDPASPTITGYCDTPGYAQAVGVCGNYAFVGDGNSLRVIDVSNPSAPTEVAHCDLPGSVGYTLEHLTISGNYVYVTDWQYGVQIIDISTPTAPVEVGDYIFQPVYPAEDVAVVGNYAYLAEYTLQIADISNKSSPQGVGSYMPYYPASVGAVSNNYVFVNRLSIFQVLSVVFCTPTATATISATYTSTPTCTPSPTVTTTPTIILLITPTVTPTSTPLPTPDAEIKNIARYPQAMGLNQEHTSGKIAFVADPVTGFLAVDCTHPSAPQILSVTDIRGPRTAWPYRVRKPSWAPARACRY